MASKTVGVAERREFFRIAFKARSLIISTSTTPMLGTNQCLIKPPLPPLADSAIPRPRDF